MAEPLPALFSPLLLPCGLTLRNRVVRAAAFAGSSVAATAATLAEAAAGGVAMCTLAYTSVSLDGRTFAEQVLLTPSQAPPDLASVARAVHAQGALLCIQLTHAGGFAERGLFPTPARAVAPSALFDLATLGFPRAATEEDMDRLCGDFAAAAATAVGAGEADGVELHLGHGYLLSQWLSPATNTRSDAHGGSAQARAAFPLRCARAVRAAIGPRKALVIKLNTEDGFPGGVSPSDVAITVRALCAEAGLVDAIVPSAGWVNKNGFFMLRGRVPRAGMVRALARTSLLKAGALALLGRWLVPELPFSPEFLMQGARAVLATARQANPGVAVLAVGGFVDAAGVEGALEEGFSGVQMARALIREPALLARWREEAGAARGAGACQPSPCSHCNLCVLAALQGARGSPRCAERPAEPVDVEDAAGPGAAAPQKGAGQ